MTESPKFSGFFVRQRNPFSKIASRGYRLITILNEESHPVTTRVFCFEFL